MKARWGARVIVLITYHILGMLDRIYLRLGLDPRLTDTHMQTLFMGSIIHEKCKACICKHAGVCGRPILDAVSPTGSQSL